MSLDHQPTNNALIHGAWYADTSVSPLVHSLRAGECDDSPLRFKEADNRAPGKPGQSGNLINGVRLFFHFRTSLTYRPLAAHAGTMQKP